MDRPDPAVRAVFFAQACEQHRKHGLRAVLMAASADCEDCAEQVAEAVREADRQTETTAVA